MANWDYSQLMELFAEGESGNLLLEGKWGLEKESLRVSPTGQLALTPHPKAFGDKINNPHVTVDFSESQIELITPALKTIEEAHRFLVYLHAFAADKLNDELLWPLSMPGSLPPDDLIPIATYDESENGLQKEIYRSGLALRYGKKMQMISGIHYNFSFGEAFLDLMHDRFGDNTDRRLFKDQVYLNLVKNFLGYRWLLIYLFGASPMGTNDYMNTFLKKNVLMCDKAGCRITFKNPVKHATSLRMSRFGYENSFQNKLNISYNSLETYISQLRAALNTKIDAYARLDSLQNGRKAQLNDNLLQSENEYYAPVRFKQQTQKGQTMLDALEEKGIDYIEIRTFDLDPFEATGIGLQQLYFTHVFMLFCAFEESGELSKKDMDRFSDNAQLTALYGRNDRLRLTIDNKQKASIESWGAEIFKKLLKIAKLLDRSAHDQKFQDSVEAQFDKLKNMDLLPSAAIISEIDSSEKNYETFGLNWALRNQKIRQIKEVLAS